MPTWRTNASVGRGDGHAAGTGHRRRNRPGFDGRWRTYFGIGRIFKLARRARPGARDTEPAIARECAIMLGYAY
jgi:hypothetical protein